MRPESRREQLLTQSVANELVIYDERTHEAHHLSATAARVWDLANGKRDLPELASAFRRSVTSESDLDTSGLDETTSEELVHLALAELDRAGLLTRALPDLAILGEPISRRKMLGVTAALLPVVASIVVPTPAMAQSCGAGTATVNPSSVVSAGGSVVVTISTTCPWIAKSLEGYITPPVLSGVGSGTATFNVGSNPGSQRTGTINVQFSGALQPRNVTVQQAGDNIQPPVAVISSPNTVMVSTSATFNGTESQGSITTYTWDFGDFSGASGAIVTHSYLSNLLAPNSQTTLTVKLTVTGPGGSHAVTKDITVFRTY